MTGAVVGPDPVLQRLARLTSRIESVPGGIAPEVQEQLARAARLLSSLRQRGNHDLIDEVEIAVNSLLDEPPNVLLARRAISGVARDVRYRGYSPATRVLVGVGILSYVFALGWLLLGDDVLGIDVQRLVGPAVFGWLGSAASIVTRINVFRRVENPFIVGLTRPLLGAAFGIFVYLALNSGVITLAGDIGPAFYLTIAFIAGFSERFVPDLIAQFDGGATTPEPPPPSEPTPETGGVG
jgi:hypothetical protein